MKFKAYPRGLRLRLAALASFSLCGALASAPLPAQTLPESPAAPPAAAAACAAQPVYPLPGGAAALQGLLAQLDALAPSCLKSAPFHAWRGAVLLALGQSAAAVEALERALLLDPDLPGAQLDYADALLAQGDRASASGLLRQLAARADLPPHLRPLLARELAAADPAAWRGRWLLATALGADSNLNNAPAASELTLTFPQGPVTLPLLPSARPRSGAASMNLAQWQGVKAQGEQLWLLQAELRARHTAQAATRYQQADLSASWLQAPQAPRQWLLRGGASRVDFGGQPLLQSLRASVQQQWQLADAPRLARLFAACRPSLGAELESRRFPASPELNGRYRGLLAALSCQGADAADGRPLLTGQALGLQLRLGHDQAERAARPGGNYRRAEIRATWQARYQRYQLNADYSYTRQLDASGYSPLLADNLARSVSRHSLRAEVAHALPPGWLAGAEGFASVEFQRQASNLAAFANRQNAFYGGLRWSLP